MPYKNILEEELKNKVARDYFAKFDCTKIVGKIDFCVTITPSMQKDFFETQSLLWAEAKKGESNIFASITQLVLTIGKARTFDKYLPPSFLGAFDNEKIAFIPCNEIHDIFYLNDFNWNVTPSNYETKEFNQIYDKVKTTIETHSLQFYFGKDETEINQFIKTNFITGKTDTTKIKIDKNNFMVVYNKWTVIVKPTIAVPWDTIKKTGLLDGYFYLADLLSSENETLKEKLFVLLKNDHYELERKIDEFGLFNTKTASFTDNQKAHTQFWNRYERPPKEEYWDYIVERQDLLVPQDIRERKGSFFTPQIWVELSQKYLADVLGENWQEEYVVWDCAAGTGNLLAGLTNKYNIWASTLDQADVDVMKDRIANGANLLESHVFQFDFLNDDFTKLPQELQKIVNDEHKRKKLVIYINPPYAEATSASTVTGTGENKTGVSKNYSINEYYNSKIGNASNEIFALFMAKIYDLLPNSILALFSKIKFIQGSNFEQFKHYFLAKYLQGFIVPANTFDNVKGNFPIAFTMWDFSKKDKIAHVQCDVYTEHENNNGKKTFYGDLPQSINKWLKLFDNKKVDGIGYMGNPSPDFQHNNQLYISVDKGIEHFNFWNFTKANVMQGSMYFTVRHCIEATWLNDRDQFLFPNDGYKKDTQFQSDCLAFTLFHGQNRITSAEGTNHWIPFTETEVKAREKFESHFMSDFIAGKQTKDVLSATEASLQVHMIFGEPEKNYGTCLQFSDHAQAVFAAGKSLWIYYHAQPNCNVNASLYDIREHFQGRNVSGKMNNNSEDTAYTQLIGELRTALKKLAKKIEPKVYEYGFLRE